ncbi:MULTISPECIES: universal stress protein [unclassified Streptomyces]|uniref:universal stress protein n=1 Tax=unclassified Streptomyces TaxID=2593676 RepID=UPI0016609103|nr:MULTISPECIES: universal stress protein [unclassified Streptomyces]MBD0708299.1 universal stress protein UspA [Streptomyces sp. CBMA291]MBD0712655.1 universal stress protein UspA [Streptomyces sp. CBMA370]
MTERSAHTPDEGGHGGAPGPVLVGADGSESALRAVETAAREARARGTRLDVVHAFMWPLLRVPLGPSPYAPPGSGFREQAQQILDTAVARARACEPDVEVAGEIIEGEPLTVLATRSRSASLVVVASRGVGAFTGLLLGSVAVHLAAHAACPVLVVRGREQPTGPVLLAVDGSADSDAAVAFAFAEAEARGAGLLAVHAWLPRTGLGDLAPFFQGEEAIRDEEQRVLDKALTAAAARWPGVSFERRLVRGRTREVLLAESAEAQLVVVGARGRGGFAGLLLGSVSQAMLHHAQCPVVVLRGELAEPDATH